MEQYAGWNKSVVQRYQYLTCIEALRDSTHHIKAITSKLDSIHTSIVKDALYAIEDGLSTLEGELVEEIK